MKALIIDDERLARNELRRMLEALPGVEVAGEARNGGEAAELIARLRPDLVLLDVQMPDCDGFELLERLDDAPAVIFTTAFDHYAVRAFEVSALDYLVKPIRPDRLAAAIDKMRTMWEASRPPALTAGVRARAASDRVFVAVLRMTLVI